MLLVNVQKSIVFYTCETLKKSKIKSNFGNILTIYESKVFQESSIRDGNEAL